MSRIDEIVRNLCPEGVKYKSLMDLCGTITTGKLNANAMVENGKYPFYTCDATPFRIDKYAFDEEAILISGNGSQVGHINYYKGKFNAYQRTYVLYDFKEVKVKYLLHYLSGYLRDYIIIHSKKGSVPYITLPMLQNFKVPVPPLEVQCEIVHILDDFTLLSAELSAELSARKKQFDYYINLLLENSTADKVKLGDCLLKVENIKWKQTAESHKYIDLSSVDRDNHTIVETKEIDKTNAPSRAQQIVKTDDVLFGGTRPMLKRSCLVDEMYNNEICSTGFCVLRADITKVLPKWIYFMISTNNFYNYVEQNQKGASYPAISDSDVKNYIISLPPINEQEKLVKLLDKFEKICNDISNGLPAEIEKRQKQYEYYRDKLLSFKEVEEDV